MRCIRCLILLFFSIFPAVASAQSDVYRLCKNSNTLHDICRDEKTGQFRGHHSIISFAGNDRYSAYFFPGREFAVILHNDRGEQASIDVSDNGLVGRNLSEGEYYPSNKTYNNTFPEIRSMFLQEPEWRRKAIQRNLKRLELYKSQVDGLWGRNTFNAIIGYNAVFKQSLKVGSNLRARSLLAAIKSHNRFDYKNGKRTTSGQGCSSTNARSCSAQTVCNSATTGNPKQWNTTDQISRNWVAEAKRRKISCGVDSYQTSQTKCSSFNLKSCSAAQICEGATSGKPRRWSSGIYGKKYATEARSRGLSCGVNKIHRARHQRIIAQMTLPNVAL